MLQDTLLTMHHTAVCVTDFERARRFYTDFLGFVLEDEMDQRAEPALGEVVGLPGACVRWAMLHHNKGYRVELFKYYTPAGDAQPRRQCDVGYGHLAFAVADVDAVYAQAMAAGYQSISSPRVLRGGRTKVFYLREPEGIITEFIQFMAMRDAGREKTS